jgi:AcrR family transcriptional regulator
MAPTAPRAPADSAVTAAFDRRQQPSLRREGERQLPAGPKAQRTRAALLDAARALFAEHGYQTTTVADVIDRAGVSFGTFYQYFRGRSDVLGALMTEHVASLAERTTSWTSTHGTDDLERMIRHFVAAYAGAAALSGVWEEACHLDDDAAALRRDLGRMLTDGVARELLRGSRSGRSRRFTTKEAELAARALTAMVDRYCYVTYVFDPPADGSPDPAESAKLLADLWAGAIGLRDSDEPAVS